MDRLLAPIAAWDIRLFTLGGSPVTLFGLPWAAVLTVVLIYLARITRSWTVNRLLHHTDLDVGTRQAIGSIVRYTFLVVGFLAIVQTAGINLTTLDVLAGALAVGVGFGLQNIFSNFISGLILMLDRSIRIGYRVEIAGADGEVKYIGARRTTIVTNDRVSIIVPNQRFVTDNVVNLGYHETLVRIRIPVPVQHGLAPRAVEELLLEVARRNPDVLSVPPPAVRLLNVAGNMQFELQAWNLGYPHRRDQLVSALNFAILEALRAHEIKPG